MIRTVCILLFCISRAASSETCLNVRNVTAYQFKGSCRRFIKCVEENGMRKGIPMCCPTGFVFDNYMQGCQRKFQNPSATCDISESCPYGFVVCTFKNGKDSRHYQYWTDTTNMPCPLGLQFDEKACLCTVRTSKEALDTKSNQTVAEANTTTSSASTAKPLSPSMTEETCQSNFKVKAYRFKDKCRHFVKCVEDHGVKKGIGMCCPPGHIFDDDRRECKRDFQGLSTSCNASEKCLSGFVVCPFKRGTDSKHYKYWTEKFNMPCPTGLTFSEKKCSCAYQVNKDKDTSNDAPTTLLALKTTLPQSTHPQRTSLPPAPSESTTHEITTTITPTTPQAEGFQSSQLNTDWRIIQTSTPVTSLSSTMILSPSTAQAKVHGGWSAWSDWGACSKSCGNGTNSRTRTCTNPTPKQGGNSCRGATSDRRQCIIKECADSELTDASTTSLAPKTTLPQSIHAQEASLLLASTTHEMTTTTTTTQTAQAQGSQTSQLSTDWEIFQTSTQVTSLSSTMMSSSSTAQAKLHGGWSGWSDWGACSKSCGSGTNSRTRTCTNPAPTQGGNSCRGATSDSRHCIIQECPVHGNWSNWNNWGSCSKSCGNGMESRTRTCTNPVPKHGGKVCSGSTTDRRNCKLRECPVHGNWSHWSNWGSCSKSCGNGMESRTRTCTNPVPKHGGNACSGSVTDSRKCNVRECPVHGNWSHWNNWGSCSKSCGNGIESRTRTCTNPVPKHGGNSCSGSATDRRNCKLRECPVHGSWSSWGYWGSCSKTCGNGIKSRIRTCTNPVPKHKGNSCSGSSIETSNCKLRECPVHGAWSAWGNFGSCSKTCGNGVKSRIRACTNPVPRHGGNSCSGSSVENSNCKLRECPVNGGWTNWNGWSSCSKTCGYGVKSRTRSCTNPTVKHGGHPCSGSSSESTNCKLRDCPVNGGWGAWSSWSSCTKSCGGGTRKRSRSCNKPIPRFGGKNCQSSSYQTTRCNTHACKKKSSGGWFRRLWGKKK